MLEDGLVSRVKRYKDLECTESELICTEEHYKNRADKLCKIAIESESGCINEYFEKGREDCVKSKCSKKLLLAKRSGSLETSL